MKRLTMLIATSALITATAAPVSGEVNVSYLYNLSDFNGVVPYTTPRIYVDDRYQETYVVSGNTVKVFNSSCMETYRFDFDATDGGIIDLTTDENGRILLLTYRDGQAKIIVCNYRGERESFITVSGLPEDFGQFTPNRIFNRNGDLYLASYTDMKVAMTDRNGSFIKGIDLAPLLKSEGEEASDQDTDIGSLNFTPSGEILVSMPIIGRIYRISADSTVQGFGKRGSAPGRFGVPSGVAGDAEGNIYVADRLRCVVLIFDKDFKFVKEFGFRGYSPGRLIIPSEIALDRSSRIYVTQQLNRGVSVYQVKTN
jgi:hypothetical protein